MDKPQSIVEHLQELRKRIVYALISFMVCLVIAVSFAQPVFHYIMATATVGDNVEIVQLTFGDAFLTQFRLAIIGALILAFPVVLYQLISFILPALKPNERRILYMGLPFATLLFVAGWSFGWFIVVPLTKTFFLDVAGVAGITPYITPSAYISFVLSICNPLGIAFELPLVVYILAKLGLVTAEFLARIRKFAFLGLLILAAFLSPPDVISMGIFLVPLYGLYEFSIIVARFARPKK